MNLSPEKKNNDTIFFISSSDNTYDILSITQDSFIINLPYELIDVYVGLNYKELPAPFKIIKVPPKNWAKELSHQLSLLPKNVENIILLLDDFWIYEKLDINKLNLAIDFFNNNNLDYLRLIKIRRSLLANLFYKCLYLNKKYHKLSYCTPYYSSLQISIWKKYHLIESLRIAKNIWHFEELVIPNSRHFAATDDIIDYRHMVEKSKWIPYAFKDITRLNSDYDGIRKINFKYDNSKLIYINIKFKIFGYTIYNIKRIFRFLFYYNR